MASIADIFVTVLPETSEIAPKIKAAFRAVDKDAAEAGRRWRGEIERELKDVKATVKVDAETARARAEIDVVARDRHSTIHVDIDKSGIDSLTTSLGGLGSASGGGGGISGMAAGIAGLIPVASALTGALGLIPAALGGAGLAAGTLITGLSGVKDAYTAVGDASKSANKDQKEKTDAVASATRELQSAVRSEASAQQDVANARKDARQQLDDLNLSLQGGKIDEAQAYNNLLKARRDLATGTFKDQLDYNDAVLRVDSAQQTYNESIQRNTELQAKANDAQSKGVDNADNVVAANDRLQQTHEQLAVAQDKVTEAQNKTSTAQQKAIDAMAQLSPAGQALINTLQVLQPAWDGLQKTVNQSLFAGVGQELQSLAQTYMPMLTTVMSSMAGTMNQTFGQIAAVLQSPAGIAGVQSLFDNLAKAFQAFMPAIPVLVQGFGQLAQVGSTFLPQLGTAFTQAAQGFTQFISQAAASGQLQQWISTGIQAMSMLGNITQTVFKAFLDLGPLGLSIISALDQTLTALAPAIPPLATAFTALVTAITPVLPMLANVITKVVSALSPALTQWLNAMAPVITQVTSALIPVINAVAPVLGQLAMIISDQLVDGIKQILPVFIPFIQQMGQLLVSVLPLLPQLMRLALTAMPMVIEVVKTILPLMTDLAKVFTFLVNTVIPPLTAAAQGLADTFAKGWPIIKKIVHEVWDDIKPILDAMKDALGWVVDPIGKLLGDDKAAKGGAPISPGGKGGAFIPRAAATPSGFDWNAVAGAESSGNWFDNNSGGHSTSSGAPRGGLQITDGTWRSYGGTEFAPTANLATPDQQKIVADRIAFSGYAGQPPQGLGAWETITKGMVPGVTASTPPPMPMAPSIAAPPVGAMPTQSALGSPVIAGPHQENMNGAVQPRTAQLEEIIKQQFPGVTILNDTRTPDGFNEHSSGEAVDIGINPGGQLGIKTAEGQALGQQVKDFLVQNATALGLQYAIFDGKNWDPDGSSNPNSGSGITGGHWDHVHGRVLPGPVDGMPSVTSAAPNSPNMPMGTPQSPMYIAPAPGQINGTGQDDPTKQLGQNVGGDLWEMFGIPGMTNPKDMGITKFFTGLLSGALGMNLGGGKGGGMPASYYANGGAAMMPGGDNGGLGGLWGMAQNFMPGMPGGNSANIADMAQFKPPGGAGSPGPGNVQAGPVFDMRGSNLGVDPAGFNQTVTDMTTSQQRWAPLQQNLPR